MGDKGFIAKNSGSEKIEFKDASGNTIKKDYNYIKFGNNSEKAQKVLTTYLKILMWSLIEMYLQMTRLINLIL